MDNTCLTFEELKKDQPDKPIMRFFRGEGCWTTIGRGKTGSIICLSEKCLGAGTIQHETFHSLGVGHEQSRYDRDGYVNIHLENVKEGYESQ